MANTSEQDLDFTKLTFGKYRGKTPEQVSEFDQRYVVWMYDNVRNSPHKPCSRALRNACENELREQSAEGDLDRLN